jgi:2-polyprenyl-3-methyl-5-hydroxy-6-metoxy-1,4-benzoquinol methylase
MGQNSFGGLGRTLVTLLTNIANQAQVYETPDIETSSADYASRFSGPAGEYLLNVQKRGIIRLLQDGRPLADRTVLDVGGGHGQLAGPIAALGCSVTVTGSDESCAERVVAGPHGDSIDFVIANLLAMPFADRQFDTVVSVRLISHITDWQRLVAELCRVADRTVIIDYPTFASLNALSMLTFPLKRAIEKNTRTYTTFSDSAIRKAFAEHGFRATIHHPQFVMPMGLHRALARTSIMRRVEERFRKYGITRLVGNPVLIRLEREDV